MALKQIDHGSAHYERMVSLRTQILRRPLGLSFTAEELAREIDDILIAAFDEEEMIGCCVLSKINAQTIRLRQMAVSKPTQGKGIGESILIFMENLARDKGYQYIMMHARETAVGFYEKFGYKINSPIFYEVGLPHYVMEKHLGH